MQVRLFADIPDPEKHFVQGPVPADDDLDLFARILQKGLIYLDIICEIVVHRHDDIPFF